MECRRLEHDNKGFDMPPEEQLASWAGQGTYDGSGFSHSCGMSAGDGNLDSVSELEVEHVR